MAERPGLVTLTQPRRRARFSAPRVLGKEWGRRQLPYTKSLILEVNRDIRN